MNWFSQHVPTQWMRDHLEGFAEKLGLTPNFAFGLYYGERDSRGRQALRVWIGGAEALVRIDVTPGGEETLIGPNGEERAWELRAERIEWVDAPALTATGWNRERPGQDRSIGVQYQLEEFALASSTRNNDAEARAFAVEYWKRWPRR